MSHVSTIIVSAILLIIVIRIIKGIYYDKKTGQNNCGGGCSGCISSGICHAKKSTIVEQYHTNSKGV